MPVCSVVGCRKKVLARTWCDTHYQRWKRHGDVTVVGKSKGGRGKPYGQENKATPKAALSPTTSEIYWAAGFLEGEGCFQRTATQQVNAAQVQREPLERLQAYFGGTIYLYAAQREGQSQKHVWSVSGTRARGVMMTLYVLMSPKRQGQIKKALLGAALAT